MKKYKYIFYYVSILIYDRDLAMERNDLLVYAA